MDRDEDGVLAANQALYQAFVTRDLARMEELWARERLVTCIHPGWNVLIGREAVMASWRTILESEEMLIEATAERAHLLGDAAYVVCLEGARGEPPMLIATNVFAREDGQWKLIHHHAGQLARPPEPVFSGPSN